MPDLADMELDARPSMSDYGMPEVNPHCTKCNGSGVEYHTVWIYDLEGNKVEDIQEDPCSKCNGVQR